MTKTPRDWGKLAGQILAGIVFVAAAAIIIALAIAIVRFLIGF